MHDHEDYAISCSKENHNTNPSMHYSIHDSALLYFITPMATTSQLDRRCALDDLASTSRARTNSDTQSAALTLQYMVVRCVRSTCGVESGAK